MTGAAFDTPYHAPVMARECCDALVDGRDARTLTILDGTLGGGGHSAALLARGARVIGVDQDAEAIREATARLSADVASGAFRALECNFADAAAHPALAGVPLDGVLLDLGVSSHQFDDAARGFSFREGAPLDMRMRAGGDTAADWLNGADADELTTAFRDYADERRAGRLAHEIVRRRANRPFATSDDLVGAIRAVLGPRSGPPEFARIFQAVRIAVNDEVGALTRALPALRDRLAPSGVLAVITYHSGEDRVVKHAIREWSVSCTCPPRQPICTCGGNHALGAVVTRKAVLASPEEVGRNPRARSAKLRVWRRAQG